MWNAVRKLSNRTNATDRPVAGIDSRTLNEHYARISRDSNYIAPSKKSTDSTNEEMVSEYEVFKLLDKLKRTATGLDELPAWFLRIGAPVISKYIAKLFGKSILEGVGPTQWKQAYIKPIAKVTSPSVPADYRPISITPVLCRVMEKLVVRSFLYPALLTAPSPLSFMDQYAFRPTGSTTAAIIPLLHKVTTLLNTHPYVIVISLDFSKAFDTVRHATLMEKYSMLDLHDCVYNWIHGFVTAHEHCTIFAGVKSPFLRIDASVFQGSGLGPVSYSVNASDLRPCTDGNDIVKFANDFDLIIPSTIVDSRSAEMQHIQEWADRNNLQLNRSKSQEIVFFRPYTRKVNIPTVPEVPGVPRVKRIKLLGVTIADNFSMDGHVDSVISSSASALYALKILRAHGMGQKDLHKVFQATVISKLQYASPSWWGYKTPSQRERFESFLRRSQKFGYYSLESPNFATICDSADKTFFHSVVSNDDHILRCLLPQVKVQSYHTRERKHNFVLPKKINKLFGKIYLFAFSTEQND